MRTKFIFGLLLAIFFISCQSAKKKIKIQFTVNGEKYEVVEKDRPLKCEITYDTFSKPENRSRINWLKHKRLTFAYLGLDDKYKKIDSIVLYSWFIVKNNLKKENSIVWEDLSSNEYTGYESVVKTGNGISARFDLKSGTKDKFHINISFDGNYANGTFSGELTSDLDSTRVIIKDGYFENIPFIKRSMDYLLNSENQ